MGYDPREFQTDAGRETEELLRRYGLGRYYDMMSGYTYLDDAELTAEFRKILKFLRANPDWALTWSSDYAGGGVWVLCEIIDL